MTKHIFWALNMALLLTACQTDKPATAYRTIEGKTMGTYYKVTYLDSLGRDFLRPVDSLLVAINREISTYDTASTISKFNRSDSTYYLGLSFFQFAKCMERPAACRTLQNVHFYKNYLAAKVTHQRTQGAFDPTVMPLVNYWGFGYTPHKPVDRVDSLKVDSLLRYVGIEKVEIVDHNGMAYLRKKLPGVQLDFGGTGQGHAIDEVATLLEMRGIKNYLVDIGGESRARGKNAKGEWWTIGINTPKEGAEVTDFARIVRLENRSVSTSGNYRNFYETPEGKFSHIVSPGTGFPQRSNLLSASVFANNCLEADALATGFMVLGLDRAYELAAQMEGIEAMFIYSDADGNLQVKQTPGVAEMLVEQ